VSITTDSTAALTDPARLAAVRRYEILDAPTDGQFDTIAAALAAVRARFEATWVRWNAIRTVLNTTAFGCLTWALVLAGRLSA
jgi:hypothetical protein